MFSSGLIKYMLGAGTVVGILHALPQSSDGSFGGKTEKQAVWFHCLGP